ncbi:hypothetical protein EG347_00655 [Chryseobacterium sp. G0186]|uniref:hypothetical protein n=1 Tax=Chryseobacterium sp. G0186 TaxID=2487064 RepID=UPI000F4D63F4|nr:hypothetical protein [Chryseobacterium sp. G0186]AZA76143.1 hypothetical protein EG347_00655 [Chryseobacterium sp. G0186]
MKYILQAFIILLLMQSCQSEELKIRFKTVEINVPGRLSSSLKHNSKYYCYFEIKEGEDWSIPITNFYILDENGKTKSKIPAPKSKLTNYDLFVRNDSVFTTAFSNYTTFYLDEKNKKWIEIKKADHIIYKDKDYTLFDTSSDNYHTGTWFKDHATGKQYNIKEESPVINKLNNDYYFTTKNYILKIPDLKKIKPNNLHNENEKPIANNKQSLEVPETEYENKLYYLSLITSFVINDQLYHLYSEDKSMNIGVLKNGELVKVQEFKSDIFPYRSNYNTQNYSSEKQYQNVLFYTNSPHFSGIIEIDKNLFNVITFKNLYREPIHGEPNINAWFEKNFDYFYSNLHTLSVDQVDRIEQQENAMDLTRRYIYGPCGEECYPIQPQLIYKKIERKYINLLTTYDYNPNNKAVERVQFEWTHPSWASFENNDKEIKLLGSLRSKKIFRDKYDRMAKFLRQKLGEPVSEEQNKNTATAKWETKTQSVELFSGSRKTSLTLYKK